MFNSVKTPTGKAKKGLVTIRPDGEYIKACFPRAPFPGEKSQVKKAVGIPLVDGWEERVGTLQSRLQLDLDEGKLAATGGMFNLKRFNEILVEYKLRPDLKIVESAATTSDGRLPPKPQLSLMKVWDMYCEYKRHELRESHFENMYQGQYKNFLESAIEATKSEDALKIRNWLVENRNHGTAKQVLSNLSKAYQRAIKNKLLAHNPFEGMAEEIVQKGARGKTQDEAEIENDDVLDRTKAYTWDEAQTIIEYLKNHPTRVCWHDFVKFKFLTGCRTGEAIALRWCDIVWDRELIFFQWTCNRTTKKFYPLKNDKTYKGDGIRRFPIPKDGELWNLLKSIPQGEPSEVVFKSKQNKIIYSRSFGFTWKGCNSPTMKMKGIIPELIKQGKLTKYLPPYNTRHTFINHAIFDLGIDEKFVSKLCGHQIDISGRHYQDVAIFAERINLDVPMTQQVKQQSEIDLLREQMRQQQELIDKLLQGQGKGDNEEK